jgi:hypothetical protein
MANKKENNRNKSEEEIKFQQELSKLKLSAERGIPFFEGNGEDEDFDEIEESNMWKHLSLLDEVLKNPGEGNEKLVKDFLKFTDYPKEKDLSDDEISAALASVTSALAFQRIALDVIHPTPQREIYRFITEELLYESAFSLPFSPIMTHFIYVEFYPNYIEEIKSDVADTLNFICRGHKASLPWQISDLVWLNGEKILKEEFETLLADHRKVFKGMSFIGVDSTEINIDESKAYAKASFRFYMDKSSGTPGEVSTDAEFYFEFFDDSYLVNRLVIEQFGIK